MSSIESGRPSEVGTQEHPKIRERLEKFVRFTFKMKKEDYPPKIGRLTDSLFESGEDPERLTSAMKHILLARKHILLTRDGREIPYEDWNTVGQKFLKRHRLNISEAPGWPALVGLIFASNIECAYLGPGEVVAFLKNDYKPPLLAGKITSEKRGIQSEPPETKRRPLARIAPRVPSQPSHSWVLCVAIVLVRYIPNFVWFSLQSSQASIPEGSEGSELCQNCRPPLTATDVGTDLANLKWENNAGYRKDMLSFLQRWTTNRPRLDLLIQAVEKSRVMKRSVLDPNGQQVRQIIVDTNSAQANNRWAESDTRDKILTDVRRVFLWITRDEANRKGKQWPKFLELFCPPSFIFDPFEAVSDTEAVASFSEGSSILRQPLAWSSGPSQQGSFETGGSPWTLPTSHGTRQTPILNPHVDTGSSSTNDDLSHLRTMGGVTQWVATVPEYY